MLHDETQPAWHAYHPTLTDEQQARLEASVQAVHPTWAAIRADLVRQAAAGDAEAAEMLARGDAHYQEHYGYAPGQGPATALAEPAPDDAVQLAGRTAYEDHIPKGEPGAGQWAPTGRAPRQGAHEAGGGAGGTGATSHNWQESGSQRHPVERLFNIEAMQRAAHWQAGDVAHAPTVEQIRDLIARNGGVHTADEAIVVGQMVRDRIHANMGATFTDFARWPERMQRFDALTHEIQGFTAQEMETNRAHVLARLQEHQALADQIMGAHQRYEAELRPATLAVLSSVRDLGGAQLHLTDTPGSDTVRPLVEQATTVLPRDWLAASNAGGRNGEILLFGQMPGGSASAVTASYSHNPLTGQGAIAAHVAGRDPLDLRTSMIHELGHRFEATVPGLSDIEQQFYERRTQGETPHQIAGWPGTYREDRFPDRYMGRVYDPRDGGPGGTPWHSYELLSRGQEWLLGERGGAAEYLGNDPEFHAFALGLLAGA